MKEMMLTYFHCFLKSFNHFSRIQYISRVCCKTKYINSLRPNLFHQNKIDCNKEYENKMFTERKSKNKTFIRIPVNTL